MEGGRGIEAMAHGKLEDNLALATSLKHRIRQIQVLDYELHATLRILPPARHWTQHTRERSWLQPRNRPG
jgi:hypothetical protein